MTALFLAWGCRFYQQRRKTWWTLPIELKIGRGGRAVIMVLIQIAGNVVVRHLLSRSPGTWCLAVVVGEGAAAAPSSAIVVCRLLH